jgi:hypothetical protein
MQLKACRLFGELKMTEMRRGDGGGEGTTRSVRTNRSEKAKHHVAKFMDFICPR